MESAALAVLVGGEGLGVGVLKAGHALVQHLAGHLWGGMVAARLCGGLVGWFGGWVVGVNG